MLQNCQARQLRHVHLNGRNFRGLLAKPVGCLFSPQFSHTPVTNFVVQNMSSIPCWTFFDTLAKLSLLALAWPYVCLSLPAYLYFKVVAVIFTFRPTNDCNKKFCCSKFHKYLLIIRSYLAPLHFFDSKPTQRLQCVWRQSLSVSSRPSPQIPSQFLHSDPLQKPA